MREDAHFPLVIPAKAGIQTKWGRITECVASTYPRNYATSAKRFLSTARKVPTVTDAASGSMAARRAALIMVW